MLTELFIENRRIDMSAEISSLLTFSIDDIKDFASRNTTFSKTIVVPGTANNNKLFGQIFDARVSNPYDDTADNVDTNFNAAVAASALMFQNHIQVFKGIVRLLEIVIIDGIPEYEIAVFGELGGLVASMGASKLEDLDFSAYDHEYTVANVLSSWDNPGGSGYYYPLIDYGTASLLKKDWDIRTFRPALYVKEYLDKIFEGAGYRYTCDLFNTSRFKSLVIPNNAKNLFSTTTDLFSANAVPEDLPGNPAEVQFTGSVGSGFTLGGGDRELTYAGAVGGTVNVQYSFTIEPNSLLATSTVLRILKNATPFFTETKLGNDEVTFSGLIAIPFSVGDTLQFQFEGFPDFGDVEIISGSITITAQTATVVTTEPGDDVVINNNLPKNILQKDFLSSIIKLFNLYLYEDVNQTKKVYLKPYVDFYDTNVSGIVDWTYKKDRSRAERLKPMSELNSRYYNFKFKSDGDYYNDLYAKRYNEGYGDNIFDSQYEFADERTDIPLIFSATPLVGYTGEDKVFSTILKINAGVEERTESNIRILQTKKITGVTSWDIKDGATVMDSTTDYGYAGHYDDPDAPANDIHFGVPRELFFTLVSGSINVTQFNVYWSPYMAEITDKDSKLQIAYFKLLNSDIYNIDFSKIIYIDGSYWRLNKIIDWNASEPDVCVCELLKIIYLIY